MIAPTIHLGAGPDLAPQALELSQATKHVLVVGATGSGKTVTLQALTEGFATAGIPVLLADVKGDLSGLAAQAAPGPQLDARRHLADALPRLASALDVRFYDCFGEGGTRFSVPLRTLGVQGLARLLSLSTAQVSTISIAFELCRAAGSDCADLDSLRAMLRWMAAHREALAVDYGLVHPGTIGVIDRRLAALASEGGGQLVGPDPRLQDLAMARDTQGRGVVSLAQAQRLFQTPQLYAALWYSVLTSLFNDLPELGPVAQPELVVVIDEAHVLFAGAPPAMIAEIEKVVRLIRSRGVALVFASQNPGDIPDRILAQLGNRIVHAMRGFAASDRRMLRALADTMPKQDDAEDVHKTFPGLATGSAVVSVLDHDGVPGNAVKTVMRPPCSRIGTLGKAGLARHLDRQHVLVASGRTGERIRAAARPSTPVGRHETRCPPKSSASAAGAVAGSDPAPDGFALGFRIGALLRRIAVFRF